MNYLQRRLVFTEAEVNMISKVIEYCKEHDKSPINKLTASGIYSKLTNPLMMVDTKYLIDQIENTTFFNFREIIYLEKSIGFTIIKASNSNNIRILKNIFAKISNFLIRPTNTYTTNLNLEESKFFSWYSNEIGVDLYHSIAAIINGNNLRNSTNQKVLEVYISFASRRRSHILIDEEFLLRIISHVRKRMGSKNTHRNRNFQTNRKTARFI